MKIQKLPAEVRTKLESGVLITDFVQCVLELVRNSLDADASGIAVRVDLKNFCIKVIDNGKGICKDDFEFVGERFMTSKYQPSSNNSFATYGYKGQALSSMLDFCRSLTIKTKSEIDGSTIVKTFVKSKADHITEFQDNTHAIGTTVIIEDFMYTMPVRRKRIKEIFELEEIKAQLQYLALIHYNVCFTLRNENKGIILLQTAKAASMLEMISNLYSKTTAKNLKPVRYEENDFAITGYISVAPAKQNNLQILFINRQVITKGVIHKFINNVMKEYNGSKTLFTDSPAEQILKKLKSTHHTFIMKIKCPRDCYELFTNLRKTTVEFKNWKDVLKCIHKSLKRTYKFDPGDDSMSHIGDDKGGGKFGASVLINAVKGVPAKRCFKRKETNNKDDKNDVNVREKNESIKTPLIDSKDERDEPTVDSLETPIPKSLKLRSLNSANSHLDISYIEFYKWLKSSFKTDVNACNLYNEFLQHRSNKTTKIESYKSPVLGVKLREKRISPVKSKIPEKKQKPSGILSEEISLMTQKSLKIFPNVDLRMKRGVQFNTEMLYELSNRKHDNEIFTNCRKRLGVIQTPASSEIHFTNILRFRNLSEPLHAEAVPVEGELHCGNTWMSHYQNATDDFPNIFEKYNKDCRDVIIQTTCPEAPLKTDVMVQTTQTIPESNLENVAISNSNTVINEIPIPDFWNISTPKTHPDSTTFCELNEMPKPVEQLEPSEFICGQKSHSNPKTNTETQTFPHLWTDSLSEFEHPVDSLPKTIPLEEICTPLFCLTERHDFVPKGLSPKHANSEAVEIPNLNSQEKNRIHLTIDETRNELLTVKWRDEITGECAKPVFGERRLIANTVNFESQILSASLSYSAVKVHNLLHSFVFTKELLSSVEVLGQLDEKFIVTRMKISTPKNMTLISLLDQHAVDERIKLEEIVNEYTTNDKVTSSCLSQPLELTFTELEARIIMDLREKLSNFGFEIKPKSQSIALINSMPSFLLDKYKKENKKDSSLNKILETNILGIISEITETRGAALRIPKIIHDAFCSEACHSAIKFNRALTKETMTEMIGKLKKCKLPFQCAHGRPSVIPIIDLEDFRFDEGDEGYNVDLQKMKKFLRERDENIEE